MTIANILQLDSNKVSNEEDFLSGLSVMEKRLLNDFQHDFPLTPTPYADIAGKLGLTEEKVISILGELSSAGAVSRVGVVFRPHRIGASTLAAMQVPEERINEVAGLVNSYSEVNHNYEREHVFNLWFVVTASDEERLQEVLRDIEQQTGMNVLYLPMIDDYHIDLGFPLEWK